MHVMEIYRSVQGEGTLMGVPTTFVRFFACNLRCSWCDTKYSWSVREGGTWETLAPQEVAGRVSALGAWHVVLTGGEPSLQRCDRINNSGSLWSVTTLTSRASVLCCFTTPCLQNTSYPLFCNQKAMRQYKTIQLHLSDLPSGCETLFGM